MKISKVAAVYISPTGNVRKTVCAMAEAIAQKLDVPMSEDDFTLPAAHRETRHFASDELVVFGTPVYAGRIPISSHPGARMLPTSPISAPLHVKLPKKHLQ